MAIEITCFSGQVQRRYAAGYKDTRYGVRSTDYRTSLYRLTTKRPLGACSPDPEVNELIPIKIIRER